MPYKDKEQSTDYQREWYHKNRENVLERRKQRRVEMRQWLRKYKSNLSCIECGEKHPACLQFHHKSRAEKSFTISNVAGKDDISLKRMMKEIEKCEVLC